MVETVDGVQREVVHIPFKNKTIKLHFDFLDLDINISELTYINYSNLYGEVVTIATLVSKVGIIRSEAEFLMDSAKLDRDIIYAQKDEYYRHELRYLHTDSKKNEIWKAPNNDAVSAAIKKDTEYITACRKYIRMKKEYGFADALFWGVKDKSGILKKIGETMKTTPEDFQVNIVEGAVNGMMVKSYENLIK